MVGLTRCYKTAAFLHLFFITDQKGRLSYRITAQYSVIIALVCLPVRGAPPPMNVITTLLCCDYFSSLSGCGIARFLCGMRIFDVLSSSSPPRLPLCQISFLSQTPLLS